MFPCPSFSLKFLPQLLFSSSQKGINFVRKFCWWWVKKLSNWKKAFCSNVKLTSNFPSFFPSLPNDHIIFVQSLHYTPQRENQIVRNTKTNFTPSWNPHKSYLSIYLINQVGHSDGRFKRAFPVYCFFYPPKFHNVYLGWLYWWLQWKPFNQLEIFFYSLTYSFPA